MRLAMIGASLAVVAAFATGCGDDSSDDKAKDAGDEKNVTAFCEANTEAGTATDLEALKKSFGSIEGTLLDDMPSDAEDGFHVLKGAVDDAKSEDDLKTFQDDLSKDDSSKVKAYNDYGKKLCTDAASSESPSSGAE